MFASIIINPTAGLARQRSSIPDKRSLAHRVCAEHGVDVRIEITERPGHATALARRSVANGAAVVLAWGGDGTMNEVATALLESTVPLGLVPAGSGNGLARELGISSSPGTAIAQALEGADRLIDAGQVGDHYFFNIAGIGLDAAIARRFNERHTDSRGFTRYLLASATELLKYRPATYSVVANGQTRTGPAVLVALANGRQYGNGVRVAPTARLDDGLLDAVVIEPGSLLSRCWRARRLFTGRLLDDPQVALVRAAEVCIEADVSAEADSLLRFHCDGETHRGPSRLVARSLPGVLRVRTPKPLALSRER